MSLNRYRLRHRASEGHRGARLAEKLLAHPDRLIGLILLLSTIVNVVTPTLVGFIALAPGRRLLGRGRRHRSYVRLLIFCEVAPKTFGALHPERLALPAAYIYTPLLLLLYPFVWATNLLANGVLRLLRRLATAGLELLEQRRAAHRRRRGRRDDSAPAPTDAGQHPGPGNATVEDIMVPRNEIVGIDVDDDWDRIVEQLRQSQHTRLPVYQGEIDRIIGVLHMKQVVHELARGRLDRGCADRGGRRARSVLRAVRHHAQHATAELSARQAPHGVRGRRIRRHSRAGDSRGHTRRDRRRIHHGSGDHDAQGRARRMPTAALWRTARRPSARSTAPCAGTCPRTARKP